jgi:SH3 domain-containing YSC84-like protein 1
VVNSPDFGHKLCLHFITNVLELIYQPKTCKIKFPGGIMKHSTLFLAFALLFALSVPAMAKDDHAKDLKEAAERSAKAAEVFREVMDTPDNSIPEYIIDRAEVIAVFPSVIKAAFIVGGKGGKGLVSIRDPQTRQWGTPVFLKLGGGSFGAQIGGESTDLILVGLNQDSANLFLKDKFELGGEASVAAGPVGRSAAASTDAPSFESQILSYSRNKGLFAGVAIKGAKIWQDKDLNAAVYGTEKIRDLSMIRTVSEKGAPADVMVFVNTLNQYTNKGAAGSAMGEDVNKEITPVSEKTETVKEESAADVEHTNMDMEHHDMKKSETTATTESATTEKTETVDTSSQVGNVNEDMNQDQNLNQNLNQDMTQKETSTTVETKPARKRLAKD